MEKSSRKPSSARSTALAALYAPRRMVLAIPADAAGLPEALATTRARDGTVAYICRGPQCSEPIAGLSELVSYLRTALNFASPGSSLE
jgi:uncharacterized protein YyaL (SSP411 family)